MHFKLEKGAETSLQTLKCDIGNSQSCKVHYMTILDDSYNKSKEKGPAGAEPRAEKGF